jgi:hypothetical protein
MHDRATVAKALRLRDEEELGARRAARRLGIPWAPCATGMLGSFPATPKTEPDRSVLAAAETSITSTNLVEQTSAPHLARRMATETCRAVARGADPRTDPVRRSSVHQYGGGGWRHPRYLFSNVSSDITSIFCTACDCLGLRWTAALPGNESKAISIYVSRKDDVARMDEFVGPKA